MQDRPTQTTIEYHCIYELNRIAVAGMASLLSLLVLVFKGGVSLSLKFAPQISSTSTVTLSRRTLVEQHLRP